MAASNKCLMCTAYCTIKDCIGNADEMKILLEDNTKMIKKKLNMGNKIYYAMIEERDMRHHDDIKNKLALAITYEKLKNTGQMVDEMEECLEKIQTEQEKLKEKIPIDHENLLKLQEEVDQIAKYDIKNIPTERYFNGDDSLLMDFLNKKTWPQTTQQ